MKEEGKHMFKTIQDFALALQKRVERKTNVYFVGGGVRDNCLGKKPSDFDYCVTGVSLQEFKELFPEAKQVIGNKENYENEFAVFLVDIAGEQTEIALARKEVNTGDKHTDCKVITDASFTIEDDLGRRDFTMNAIAINVLTGEVIDPYNGREDIKNKIIRATSKAFQEDPLRILRAARFAAKLGFKIEKNTEKMMFKMKHKLKSLPKERIILELTKVFDYDTPSYFFRSLEKAGVLVDYYEGDTEKAHFYEIAKLVGVEQPIEHHPEGCAFEHTMQVLDASAMIATREKLNEKERYILLFSGLCHDFGKGLSPYFWEKYPDKHPIGSHRGHERNGVKLVKEFSERLGVPNDWKNAAMQGSLYHMHVHILNQISDKKIVDMLEGIDDVYKEAEDQYKKQQSKFEKGLLSKKKWEEAQMLFEKMHKKHKGTKEKEDVYALLRQGVRKSKLGYKGLAFLSEADEKGRNDITKEHLYSHVLIEYGKLLEAVKVDKNTLPPSLKNQEIGKYKKKLQVQKLKSK